MRNHLLPSYCGSTLLWLLQKTAEECSAIFQLCCDALLNKQSSHLQTE